MEQPWADRLLDGPVNSGTMASARAGVGGQRRPVLGLPGPGVERVGDEEQDRRDADLRPQFDGQVANPGHPDG